MLHLASSLAVDPNSFNLQYILEEDAFHPDGLRDIQTQVEEVKERSCVPMHHANASEYMLENLKMLCYLHVSFLFFLLKDSCTVENYSGAKGKV